MSNNEQFGRSPMASRRVRRHAMGVSNAHSLDEDATSISRSTVSLIHADRLVKVPQHLRSADPAARESRKEDRPVLTRLHDKLFKTHRERYVRKVLRSCASDGDGVLTREQLRGALERLNVGLEREERERIIARVAPEEGSRVHYLDFLKEFEIPKPLGNETVAVARGVSVPGPPVVRPGGGGGGVGDGGRSYWNWQRHGKTRIPGLLDQVRDGSIEQSRSDALLTGLLVSKLGNCRDKLRAVFRQMDTNRNSLIDREEFAKGVAELGIDASREQVDRLFELCDTDRSGFIDYTEFAERFEERGRRRFKRVNKAGVTLDDSFAATAGSSGTTPTGGSGGVPLAHSLALSPDEVQGALRHPLVLELARSLYGKGSHVTAPFKQMDLPRSGRLDLHDMTTACRALVPGIGERQVAAVMAAVNPEASSQVDYREFIARVEGGLSHPRLAHSAPPGGKAKAESTGLAAIQAGGSSVGALARFGEPLTVPDPLPTRHTRVLSAVSLSRSAGVDGDSPQRLGSSVPPPPPPPLPGKTAPDRDSLYKLHAVAITPFLDSLDRAAAAAGENSRPLVTRSVEVVKTVTKAEGSQAPSHAAGRFSRFWSRRYADTTSITSADPASAMYIQPKTVFVRKGSNEDFLQFQRRDQAKEARRREQLVQRYKARSEADSRYSAQDDASGANDGRLEVARAAKQRYEERCEMYDRVRQIQDKGDHTVFGHLPVFGEHKSDTANLPVREDQKKLYW